MSRRRSKKNRADKQNQRVNFKPKTQAQAAAYQKFLDNDILFLLGPAGTGKTFLATAFAIKELVAGGVDKIVIARPIVEAGESLGFLPGDLEEKVDPYMRPIFDCIDKLVGYATPLANQVSDHTEISPLAYMRGRTFDNAVCILDEAQNCTMEQLKMFITRFGEDSKIIISGDHRQSDIRDSGLLPMAQRIGGIEGIGVVKFPVQDVIRHPLITEVLEVLED